MKKNKANILIITTLFSFLIRKWWLIILAGVIGGVIGIYYASQQEAKYESRLTFALEANSGSDGIGSALNIASDFGLRLGGGKSVFDGDNIMEIFRSRRMIEQVLMLSDTTTKSKKTLAELFIRTTNLEKKFSRSDRLRGVTFSANQPRSTFSYLQDSALYLVFQDITVNRLSIRRPDKRLNIYEIKITGPDRQFCKIFLQYLIVETSRFYTELRSRRSRETLTILEQRVRSLKGTVNAAISSKAAVRDANLNPAFSVAQAPVQAKEVELKLFSGAYGELYKNLELARYQYLKEIPLLQIIDEPRYPIINGKKGRFSTGVLLGLVFVLAMILILIITKYVRITFNNQTNK